jgi:hypothetical protein
MSLVILLCLIFHHAFDLVEMLPNFLLTFIKFIIIFFSFVFFYVTPEFTLVLAVLISYKGSEIKGCYRGRENGLLNKLY